MKSATLKFIWKNGIGQYLHGIITATIEHTNLGVLGPQIDHYTVNPKP
jgi:hypothetical protein